MASFHSFFPWVLSHCFVCCLTIKAVYVENHVSSLAIGGPLQQTGWVRPDVLRPNAETTQTLKQTVLTPTVVALWAVV